MQLPFLIRPIVSTKRFPRHPVGRAVDKARAFAKRVASAARSLREPRKRRPIVATIRYRLFVLERRWQIHPVFGRIYPERGWPRRIAAGLLAFILVGTGFFAYFASHAKADWYNTTWVYRKAITIDHTKVGLSTPAIDAKSKSEASPANSLTWAHTVGSQSNRIFVVGVDTTSIGTSTPSNTVEPVSTVTYNGVSLTQLSGQNCPTTGDPL